MTTLTSNTKKTRIVFGIVISALLTSLTLIMYSTTPTNKAEIAINELCNTIPLKDCHTVKYNKAINVYDVLEQFDPLIQTEETVLNFHRNNTLKNIITDDENLSVVFVIQENNSIAGPQTTTFFLIKENNTNKYYTRIAR